MEADGNGRTTAVGLESTPLCDYDREIPSTPFRLPQNSLVNTEGASHRPEEIVTTFRGAIRGAIRGAASATLSNLEDSGESAAASAARYRCAGQ